MAFEIEMIPLHTQNLAQTRAREQKQPDGTDHINIVTLLLCIFEYASETRELGCG